jgi:hypothetical protein
VLVDHVVFVRLPANPTWSVGPVIRRVKRAAVLLRFHDMQFVLLCECVKIQTEDSFKDTTATPIATELRELLDTMMKDEKA